MEQSQLTYNLGYLINEFEKIAFLYLPKFLMAVIIFLIGYALAKIVKSLLNKFLGRIDRIIPNKRLQERLKQLGKDPITRLISNLLYWIIIIFFLTAATEILGLPIITNWLGGLATYLPNLLLATILIFTGLIGGRLLKDLISTAITKTGAVYGEIIGQFAYYMILGIAVLLAVAQVGVDLAILTGIIDIVLAALLFGAALAFGIGAKTSINNILACYYLQSRYHIGEIVKIDDHEGQIIEFTATSLILDSDMGQVTIPAKKFSEQSSILIKRDLENGSSDRQNIN